MPVTDDRRRGNATPRNTYSRSRNVDISRIDATLTPEMVNVNQSS